MTPTLRPYQSEDDFWRMREFLRRVCLLNDRLYMWGGSGALTTPIYGGKSLLLGGFFVLVKLRMAVPPIAS